MSLILSERERSRFALGAFPRNLFGTPEPAGRKITAGFTYLQRIGKAGTYDVWFPEKLKHEIDARIARGQKIGPQQFPAQWAAIRQFELLQEAWNYKIYDLSPEKLERSMMDLTKSMHAGGYRITVATLGQYAETSAGDELEILDLHLQEEIAQMIHMLYLDKDSEAANAGNDARLASGQWTFAKDLPHIGVVLGAENVFKRLSGGDPARAKRHRLAEQFFDILGKLPKKHIVHDTAIGLQLPELIGENQWIYIADPEETFAAFSRLMTNIFEKFDGVSLDRLQERAGAGDEIMRSTSHLRGYGDRLNATSDWFYEQATLALA